MVDHEVLTKEDFTLLDEVNLRPQESLKQYVEKSKEFSEKESDTLLKERLKQNAKGLEHIKRLHEERLKQISEKSKELEIIKRLFGDGLKRDFEKLKHLNLPSVKLKVDDNLNKQNPYEKNLHQPSHLSKQLSEREVIKNLLKQYTEETIKNSPVPNEKLNETRNRTLQYLHEKLSESVKQLLSKPPADCENTIAMKEVRELEGSYKHVTETFLVLLSKYLKSIKDLRQEVIRTLKRFQMVSRVAAKVTLGSSITNVSLALLEAVAQRVGNFPWLPSIPLISNIVAGLTLTASLLTISHMAQTTTDIARDMRREQRVVLELMTAYREGCWVDERVQQLFPFGINLDFVVEKALETNNYFENRYYWKKYLSSSIILSNIHKDVCLLDSDEFLTKVKLFVESPAAEIWWSRIKIRRLLEALNQKEFSVTTKDIMSAHESYVSRTALYLYPLLLPWLVSSWRGEEMRCLCSIMAGALAASDLKIDSRKEVQELKTVSSSFEKDFHEIEAICEILDSNDD